MFEGRLRRHMEEDPAFAVQAYSALVQRATRKHGPTDARTLSLRHGHAVALHRNREYERAEAEFAALIAARGQCLLPGIARSCTPGAGIRVCSMT